MKKVKILYGDIIVIVFTALLSLMLFILPYFSKGELKAEIYLNGEKYESIRLSSVDGSYSVDIGSCRLLIEKDGVSFISSSCKDKLCVNYGKLEKAGDTMACLPERVTVTLKSEKGKSPDGVTY